MSRPLENLVVLEFCQFMAGPSAGLRLADLGARVIKIERPVAGESGRQIAIRNLFSQNDSIVFHTINRNKESYSADLKSPEDLQIIKKLVAQADVMTHNFRPGVMEKIGLDYSTVREINPRIIYGMVTGYGSKGPWLRKPGQDLLVQSLSGLTWLSGDHDDPPTPFGLAVADILCGGHFVQGILAALIRRGKTGSGALVEVSLLESLIDFQFEVITTYLNDGGKQPSRASKGNGHAYLSAPYGIYQTRDRHIALAMEELDYLGSHLDSERLSAYHGTSTLFAKRDEIMELLQNIMINKTTAEWLAILEPADIWCADVLNYDEFLKHEAYRIIDMEQEVITSYGDRIKTLRYPVRIDGEKLFSTKSAPLTGENNNQINKDFHLNDE